MRKTKHLCKCGAFLLMTKSGEAVCKVCAAASDTYMVLVRVYGDVEVADGWARLALPRFSEKGCVQGYLHGHLDDKLWHREGLVLSQAQAARVVAHAVNAYASAAAAIQVIPLPDGKGWQALDEDAVLLTIAALQTKPKKL